MTTDDTEGVCTWALSSPEMRAYHDTEWGVPSRDDRHLFELLTLEGAQAGLSWATILKRRAGYRTAFAAFDPAEVARFDGARLARILEDPGVIRNRLKVHGTRTNAEAFLEVQREHGSFADYLWAWVDGERVVNHPETMSDLEPASDLAKRLSRDLKRRGFTFVGPTIVQSFLQATGVIDDHLVTCTAKQPESSGH